MEFKAFGFIISLLNFLLMFFLFYQVVILPMEQAVQRRRRRVDERLAEIRKTLADAQRLEAEVKGQMTGLEAEKQEMRESAAKEVARVQARFTSDAERDALHLVEKTRREAEKNRQEVLASLNRELADKAMAQTQEMLARAFDQSARESSAQATVSRLVGVNRAS